MKLKCFKCVDNVGIFYVKFSQSLVLDQNIKIFTAWDRIFRVVWKGMINTVSHWNCWLHEWLLFCFYQNRIFDDTTDDYRIFDIPRDNFRDTYCSVGACASYRRHRLTPFTSLGDVSASTSIGSICMVDYISSDKYFRGQSIHQQR